MPRKKKIETVVEEHPVTENVNPVEEIQTHVEDTKHLSFAKLDKVIKKEYHGGLMRELFEMEDGSMIEVCVKHTISIREMSVFVDLLADSVFMETKNGDTAYDPARYNSVFDMLFLEYYTNVKSNLGLDRLLNLRYNTYIMDRLREAASERQLRDIDSAAKDAIEFRKNMILSSERTRLNKMANQISTEIDKLTPVFEMMTKALDGMTSDDLTKAMKTFVNMDEEKLANAVLNQKDNVVKMPVVNK